MLGEWHLIEQETRGWHFSAFESLSQGSQYLVLSQICDYEDSHVSILCRWQDGRLANSSDV